ncbi:MAG TPA: ABC transporter substrate-binding protein [Trueperaceae bacterium]|nr:ABC transporter substrate-binding protein [Trueperaceae bacterium]
MELAKRSLSRRSLAFALAAAIVGTLLGTASAQTITMAMAAQPDTLDPQVTSATAAFQVSKSIYDTLVEVDRNGDIVPALAQSYEVAEDSLSYTFHLTEATFHDGTALDAQDVVATLQRMLDPETASPKLSEFAAITGVEATDDRTVVVSLSQPAPALIASLASGWGAILPSEKIESGHDFGNQPVGTGPFAFVEWQRDNSVTLNAFADYYQGAPQVDQVVIRFVPDSAVQLQGLTTGEFDVIDTVASADQATIESNADLALVRDPSGLALVAAINTRREALADPRVRQAFNHAVDSQTVLDVAYGGGTPIGTFMEAGSPWMPDSIEPFAYDPERAQELLNEAGASGLSLDMALPQPYENHIQAGQMIQDYLSDVGVSAEIRIVEWGVWLSDVYGGAHDYDLTVIGHTGKLDPTGRLDGYATEADNYPGFDDPEMAAWLESGSQETDPDARRQVYTNVLQRMHDGAPFIYIGTPDRVHARKASLEGFWITPMLDSFDFRTAHFE